MLFYTYMLYDIFKFYVFCKHQHFLQLIPQNTYIFVWISEEKMYIFFQNESTINDADFSNTMLALHDIRC